MFRRRSHEQLAQDVESIRNDTRKTRFELTQVAHQQKEIETRLEILQQELEVQMRKYD